MSDLEAFCWVTAGIVLSIVIPFAIAILKPPPSAESMMGKAQSWLVFVLKTYGKYAGASLALGLLALAVARAAGMKLEHWYDALLIGYAWDSTLEKVFRRNV